MPSYERETTIDAPLDEVWEFYSRVSGLRTVTPSWMRLRVESVRGPDGESNPDVLKTNSEVSLSIRPFGVGPRRGWTSRITNRERTGDVAYFRDEMLDGPFDYWAHSHKFYADGDRTLLRDHVDYRFPYGGLGRAVETVAWPGFEAVFATRHRATREHLE